MSGSEDPQTYDIKNPIIGKYIDPIANYFKKPKDEVYNNPEPVTTETGTGTASGGKRKSRRNRKSRQNKKRSRQNKRKFRQSRRR